MCQDAVSMSCMHLLNENLPIATYCQRHVAVEVRFKLPYRRCDRVDNTYRREMDKLSIIAWTPKPPLWIFALMLVTTFVVEGAIMLLLPFLPTWSRSPLFQGVLDASILTLVMAPVIWWLVVKPLRHLSESRGHLLHSLFQSQEQERSRIARDLHDEIGQQLTALLVGLGTVESAKDLPSAHKC